MEKIEIIKYKEAVIDEIKKMIKNKETMERFEKYIKLEDFETDIKNNYRDNATVSACAYNIYMWI